MNAFQKLSLLLGAFMLIFMILMNIAFITSDDNVPLEFCIFFNILLVYAYGKVAIPYFQDFS